MNVDAECSFTERSHGKREHQESTMVLLRTSKKFSACYETSHVQLATSDECQKSIMALTESKLWKENLKLRNLFAKKCLPNIKVYSHIEYNKI